MSTTAIKPKNQVERFVEFLQQNLSAGEYNTLYLAMGHNATNRLTRLLNPESGNLGGFNASEVEVLSQKLRIPPQDLITQWGLGISTITLDEANALVQEQGIALGFQYAA